jgi:amino acid adenylation domain-containing protein
MTTSVSANESLQYHIEHRSTAALSHALRVRLPRSGACEPGKALAAHASPGVWEQWLGFSADSSPAVRMRLREMSLAAANDSRSGYRAVLLHYHGGLSDLIVTAHRAALSRRELQARVDAVLSSIGAHSGVPPLPTTGVAGDLTLQYTDSTALSGCEITSGVEWGQGAARMRAGDGYYQSPFTHAVPSPAFFLASVGLVLRRLGEGRERGIGLLGDGITLLSLATGAAATAGQYLSAVESRLHTQQVWATPGVMGSLRSQPDHHDTATVGMIWDRDVPDPEGLFAREYRSCLAPAFPLTLCCETREGSGLRVTYAFELAYFDVGSIERFDTALATVCRVFRAVAAGGNDLPLAAVPLLDSASPAGSISSGGKLSCDSANAWRIEAAIATLARKQPQASAVSYLERTLSYAELDALGNQIARALAALEVQPGSRVGVHVERSIELVALLLAILKAGAAYVPIDPSLPPERVGFTAQDAAVSLLVTSQTEPLPAAGLPQVGLEQLLAKAAAQDSSPCRSSAKPTDPAYIIYTSGSTGRPKGVEVPHINVWALITATRDGLGLGHHDTWTLFHSTAFDFSVWEIWGCLSTGGQLVVIPFWVSRAPDELLLTLAAKRVSVLNLTPSAFAQLQGAEARASVDLGALRLIIFGGEPLDCTSLRRWFDRHPPSACRVVNMFGITETTVHVTAETITRRHALTASRVVGRPIPGWQVYVMDESGHVLPRGAPGEIYVGGAGVALGYLNRPELTSERFLNDPSYGRLYRSGDRGRLLPDGRLEHLGRLDSQVKIRGFRIELDEIRAVLLECPNVTAGVVLKSQGRPGDAATIRLDAYVAMSGAGDPAAVQAHLRRWLPEHMLPNTLTVLPQLPLTVNGKLDISRLAQLRTSVAAEQVDIPAVTETSSEQQDLESHLQSIWTEVLGVRCGVNDNFFQLGGNSLQAVRIVTAMRDAQLPQMPMREFYQRQTIHSLAEYFKRHSAAIPAPLRRVR